MIDRIKKQRIIAGVYVAIVALLSVWIYFAFLRVPPTCSDGIKNQNETAIDCGGVCGMCQDIPPAVDMRVDEAALLYGGSGKSDVLVKVYNPNDRYGAAEFSYTVRIKNSNGSVIVEKKDTSFVLPKETKYLLQIGLPVSEAPASAEVSFDTVPWQILSNYREEPKLPIYSKRYGPVPSGVGFGQADGTLSNESGFDFQTLMVKVVLRDASGNPIAINKTEMRTVIAGDRRDFSLVFPSYFPGDVTAVEAEAEADVYRSDNFVREHLPGGAFQKL